MIILGCFLFWSLPSMIANTFMPIRSFFAWSFDRLMPEKLADVNERTHSPVIAIVVVNVIIAGLTIWSVYSNVFQLVLGLIVLAGCLGVVIVGVAAIALPLRRPDLYRSSPANVKFLGIPVLFIVAPLSIGDLRGAGHRVHPVPGAGHGRQPRQLLVDPGLVRRPDRGRRPAVLRAEVHPGPAGHQRQLRVQGTAAGVVSRPACTAAVGVFYAAVMGSILVGTASWTDKTLIASGWYPPEADTPEKRLRFYARQFPLVEVDATYYALPAEQTATSWAERTPAGFTFNVKAFSLFTQHPTPVKALPTDLREAAGKAGKDRVYLKDVDPAVADQAWDRFLAALEPLRQAGKLGAILLQFPPWFPIGRSRKDYIVACAARAAPRRVCIEFRNKTWMSPENQEETLGFLASHQLPYVCVDMPQGYTSSIPPVLAVTSDLAVVRMHGHSDKWDSKDIYERFGYRYSDGELG